MFWSVTLSLLEGFWMTIKLFLMTLAFSIPLGLVLGLSSMSRFKPLSILTRVVVWIVRGSPLMIQLLIIYYFRGQWMHRRAGEKKKKKGERSWDSIRNGSAYSTCPPPRWGRMAAG